MYVAGLSTGHKFYYKQPTDLACLLLGQQNAEDQFIFTWSYNEGYIDRPYHTDGWLDYVAYFWQFIVAGYEYVCTVMMLMLS